MMTAQTLLALVAFLAVQSSQPPMRDLFPSVLPIAKYANVMSLAPVRQSPESIGVEVTARSAVVMDVGSGRVLFEKDADVSLPIASMTKLITAMTFLDGKPKMEEVVEVLPEDEDEDAKGAINDHESLTNGDLLQALLVGSVNKAANAIARSHGGKESFVRAMNHKARTLQLRGAAFVDPSGIHAGNQATARDVALVMRAALSYPEIRAITERSSASFIGRTSQKSYDIKSTNLLLTSYLNHAPYQILIGKTGSLPQAGFCLSLATRFQEQHDVVVVVLNSDNHFSRFQDVKALTTWAFDAYTWPSRPMSASVKP